MNKGKFKQNSRYVAKKNEGTTHPSPSSHKRKARHYDDTESEPEQAVQEAKKGCTRAQGYVGLEALIVGDLAILSPDRWMERKVRLDVMRFYTLRDYSSWSNR